MGDSTVNMPEGLGSGKDWSETLQKIVAYGSGRLFDAQAVSKIYKSTGQAPQMMDANGNTFTAGQPNNQNDLGGVPLIFWVMGGVLLFLMVKD